MLTETVATPTSAPGALTRERPSARLGPVTVAVAGAGEGVLEAGVTVAVQLDRGIAVLSVIEPDAVFLWNAPSLPDDLGVNEQASLARWSILEEEMREAAERRSPWSVEILRGGAARTVARAAHELHSPVIVMGIGRRAPIDRLLGGETAIRTLRHATCPVLAITPGFAKLPTTVVAGTDFSSASSHAIRAALPLLPARATLILTHVWHPFSNTDPRGYRYNESYRSALPGRFARFIDGLKLPEGLVLSTDEREGVPAAQLVAVARERGADLLVVGRRGRGMLHRLLVGSVAAAVLRGAECSVLAVPELASGESTSSPPSEDHTARSVPPDDWASFLDDFTIRFAGQLVELNIADAERGYLAREHGYVLFGTSYDRAGGLEIILGERHGRRRHLTHSIADPCELLELLGASGAPRGIRVVHRAGSTLLTLARSGSE